MLDEDEAPPARVFPGVLPLLLDEDEALFDSLLCDGAVPEANHVVPGGMPPRPAFAAAVCATEDAVFAAAGAAGTGAGAAGAAGATGAAAAGAGPLGGGGGLGISSRGGATYYSWRWRWWARWLDWHVWARLISVE